MNFVNSIGMFVISIFEQIGLFVLFFLKVLYNMVTPPFYFKNILKQMVVIGFYSLPLIAITALFSGMVMTLQIYSGFSQFNAMGTMALIIVLAVVRELGPVFAGLMISARSGSSISAEIGTMRVSEQIDALTTLSVEPMKYLVAPRIWAGILVMPLLVLVADIIGIFGGYFVGTAFLNFPPEPYLYKLVDSIAMKDVVSGMIKGMVFGFIITTIGAFFGYNTKQGAKGVGMATTNAVVISAIMVLLFNYVLTDLFFTGG